MEGKRKEKEGGDVERLSHSRKTWRGGFATSGPVCEQLKTQKPHVCLGACGTHTDTYVILFQGTDWGITEEVIVQRGQLASWGRLLWLVRRVCYQGTVCMVIPVSRALRN